MKDHTASTTRVLAAILALGVVACGSAGDPLEQAREAVEEGDATRAIAYYQEYLAERPDDYAVLKEYTLTLGEQWAVHGGDRTPIIENLERLYERRPGDSQVQGLLSVMLIREAQAAAEARRYEDAESLYRRAIAVNPESGAAQYNLGILYADQHRPDDAFAQYRAAAAKRPPIPDLYLRLGRAYLQQGDADRAITTLGVVFELRGMSTYLVPEAHCALAHAYHSKGMRSDALEHLDEAGEDCRVEGLAG